VPGRERLGRPAVEHDGVLAEAALQAGGVEAGGSLVVVEQISLPAVGVGRVREVGRCQRLALGDDRDERILRHGPQGIVLVPLLADRRRDGIRQRLPASRAGPWAGNTRVRSGRVSTWSCSEW